MIDQFDIKDIYCEEAFLEDDIKLLEKLKIFLASRNISLHIFNCTLLWEPYSVLKDDGTPYKVFTPFYRKGCVDRIVPPQPLGKPNNILYANIENKTNISHLNLLSKFQWYNKLNNIWEITEKKRYKFSMILQKVLFTATRKEETILPKILIQDYHHILGSV